MNSGGRSPAMSVVNLSWGAQNGYFTPIFVQRLHDILNMMVNAGVTVVMAGGNAGNTAGRTHVDTYPQMFADLSNQYYIPSLTIVGASDQYGRKAGFSQTADYVTIYAGGKGIYTVTETNYIATLPGTSFAAPQVAALAAYFKGLSSQWQTQLNQANNGGPAAVKALITAYQRWIVPPATARSANADNPTVKVVWNGMDQTVNCLLDYPNGGDPNNVCPNIGNDPTTYTPPPSCAGIEVAASPALLLSSNNTLGERQSGDTCTLPGGGSGGTVISFTTGGIVGPTCSPASACGGVVCSGYWCSPTPMGDPPGYQDPKDPSSAGNNPSQSKVTQGFPTGSPTTSTPTTTRSPTTSSTPTQSITPLTRGPINCFDESNFPGHGDINSDSQDDYSQDFSNLDTQFGSLGPDSAAVKLHQTDSHGINYDFSASWVPGCVTTVDTQNFGFPLGSPSEITAYLLVREDYTMCDNGGVGGSCQAGCLLYTFTGGLGD
ncbi:peptidase S8/S53 domain-containing protein [Xylariaceae sp. FL0255]|nr:peptidase S8/S53 domain-containing protein [Xylariaceae sp. FL0255]